MADFKQAVEWMKVGKKARRPHWCSSVYINQTQYKGIIKDEDETVSDFGIDDFEATDWELYKEKIPLSDYIRSIPGESTHVISKDRIKEAIKELKNINRTLPPAEHGEWYKGFKFCRDMFYEEINRIFGTKLTEEN